LDIIVNQQEGKIITLENSLQSQHESFTRELAETNDKLSIQKEITEHTESVSKVYKEENEYLKKRVRRLKWQRVGLGALVIVVTVLSL
jgi:hypothetical protein